MRKSQNRWTESGLPDHIFVLIEGMRRRIQQEMAALPPMDMPRPSIVKLLQMVPREGIRITDYAARAGMTKQSLGEFVDRMEADGLVASGRLPDDRRVRLVHRTAKGDKISDESITLILDVEQKLRAQVGASRYDTMRAVMRELGGDYVELPD
jgi:DNA-binding MarR family transcriptional regulator